VPVGQSIPAASSVSKRPEPVREVLPPAGILSYQAGFLSVEEAKDLFAHLHRKVAWAQRSIVLFGRAVKQPRLTAFHGDQGIHYRYSGRTLRTVDWTEGMHAVRRRLLQDQGLSFNCVLCNAYRDGNDAMGWHADDEPELGPLPTIASLSLGESRRFLLKPRGGGERRSLLLEHGSLLLMSGDLQAHWLHCLPRTRRAVGWRINLTFRTIVPRD